MKLTVPKEIGDSCQVSFLTHSEIDDFFSGTTFGMEYDCGAFDRHRELRPELGRYCKDEVQSHSNVGIGVDPKARYNLFGGEVQVEPTDSEAGLLQRIDTILTENLATDRLAFSGTIHVHVRIPQLLERPDVLRYLVRWCADHWSEFDLFDWEPRRSDTEYASWLEWCMQTCIDIVYDELALYRMDQAPDDVVEIVRALHGWPKTWQDWKNEWHVETDKQKRPAVNFGHLAINETVEFRCFQVTTDRAQLKEIIEFPLKFLRTALLDLPGRDITSRILRPAHAWNPHYDATTRYFKSDIQAKQYIVKQLISGSLTIADLNYPKFWIDKGFQ